MRCDLFSKNKACHSEDRYIAGLQHPIHSPATNIEVNVAETFQDIFEDFIVVKAGILAKFDENLPSPSIRASAELQRSFAQNVDAFSNARNAQFFKDVYASTADGRVRRLDKFGDSL